jgi:Ca2+-binding RTX toxin-like protein
VTVLPNGFIVVTWTRPVSATDRNIMGRVIDQGGNAVSIDGRSDEFVITASATDDVLPAVSRLLGGKFITSWQDSDTGDGSGGQITSTVSEISRTTVGDGAADTFTGDQLPDLIKGNGGGDTLNGAIGNDTLIGGPGADMLTGGPGLDQFWYNNAAEGVDQIVDFQGGQDSLAVHRGGFGLVAGVGLDFVFDFAAMRNGVPALIERGGEVFFDQDGSGANAPVLLAHHGIAQASKSLGFTAGSDFLGVGGLQPGSRRRHPGALKRWPDRGLDHAAGPDRRRRRERQHLGV